MGFNPVIVLLTSNVALESAGARWAARLRAYGFEVLECRQAAQLHQLAQERSGMPDSTIFVLAAQHAQNCTAAMHLRSVHPRLAILALGVWASESTQIAALQAGADACCPQDATTPLFVAMLLRVLGRSSRRTAPPSSATQARGNAWALQDQGWVLLAPGGKAIPLTTGERAILITLLAAPDGRATHGQLIDSLSADNSAGSHPGEHRRLGLLISRMRSKVRQQGVVLPLKSMHKWGYMFTGPLQQVDGPASG